MSQIVKSDVETKVGLLNSNHGFDIEMISLGKQRYVLKAINGKVDLVEGSLYQLSYFLDGILQGIIMETNSAYRLRSRADGRVLQPRNRTSTNEEKDNSQVSDRQLLQAIGAARVFEQNITENPRIRIKARNNKRLLNYEFFFDFKFSYFYLDTMILSGIAGMLILRNGGKVVETEPITFSIDLKKDYVNLATLRDYYYYVLEYVSKSLDYASDNQYKLFVLDTKKEDIVFNWAKLGL